ncbi:hypothetical protein JCM21900_003603 [Sporobolomyces salmonicolor]
MSNPSPTPLPGTSSRPLIDRRRSSSRERGLLLRPSTSGCSRMVSPPTSPVGSPPLRSVLKHHPPHQIRVDPPTAASSPMKEAAGSDGIAWAVSASTPMSNLSLQETPVPAGNVMEPSASNASMGAQFRRRVGFDTFGAGNDLEGKVKGTGGGTGVVYSFTLSAKSSNYCRTRWSRTFLVATDLNEYSVNAVRWLLTSLAEDGDEVVVLRVIEPGSSAHNAWRASMEEAREEAEDVLEDLMKMNGEERQISLIVEFAIGPIEETIHRMIEIYKPDSLIVGTRGRPDSLFKSAFMGSISKWAVARSPVPVVVVRPDDKVREALERRLQDSKRGRSYVSLLSPEEREKYLATSGAFGAVLERTVTAPSAGDREGEEGGRGRSGENGGKAEKADEKKKKKDKGKEMKRFGTFS